MGTPAEGRMTERRELPYGSWPSPITIDMAVGSQIAFREPRLFGADVFWTEGRPAEGGRQVIVRWSPSTGASDVTPPPFNARTMIHEYGGGWYTVDERDGTVYFTSVPDNRIYRQAAGASPAPLTAEAQWRFGDLVLDAAHGRLVCIREDHTGLDGNGAAGHDGRIPEPRNELVAVDMASGEVTILATGRDFYSSPRLARDGRIAWL